MDTDEHVNELLKRTVDALCTCDYLIPSSVRAFSAHDHKAGCSYVAFLKRAASLVELPEVKALIEADRPVYKQEWAWRIYHILEEKDYELSEQFANFMQGIHAAFAPFEEIARDPEILTEEEQAGVDAYMATLVDKTKGKTP